MVVTSADTELGTDSIAKVIFEEKKYPINMKVSNAVSVQHDLLRKIRTI